MRRNVITVDCNGHHKYYSVTQDGVRAKRITHDELFINGDIINIEEWFKLA